jgi:hypothetical protein
MNFLYAIKVLIITKTEEERAAAMTNWTVEPGHPMLKSLLDDSQKEKGDQHQIIVSVDNQRANGVVDKALAYFEKKLGEKRENMLVIEINYLGEGAI